MTWQKKKIKKKNIPNTRNEIKIFLSKDYAIMVFRSLLLLKFIIKPPNLNIQLSFFQTVARHLGPALVMKFLGKFTVLLEMFLNWKLIFMFS